VGRVIDGVVGLGLEEKVPGLARRHRHQPAREGGDGRILEDHHIRKKKADRADEVQRLVNAAVMVVAMIVPTLGPQSCKKAVHRHPPL
jgi:hypothetical protein